MKKIENMAMDIEYDGRLVLDGQIMPEMVPDGATPEEKEAIHKRMHALWTAARGMSTAEAVSLLNGTHLNTCCMKWRSIIGHNLILSVSNIQYKLDDMKHCPVCGAKL